MSAKALSWLLLVAVTAAGFAGNWTTWLDDDYQPDKAREWLLAGLLVALHLAGWWIERQASDPRTRLRAMAAIWVAGLCAGAVVFWIVLGELARGVQ